MKKRLIILRSIIIVILLFILTLTSCQSKKKNNLIGNDIVFAVTADSSILDSTEFKYDLNELENQIDTDSSYVYLNPKKTDYKIVEKFGFDINDYTIRNGERYYKSDNGLPPKVSITIDEFGAFKYMTDIPETYYEILYSEEDCVKIAKDYLIEYGIWDEKILDENNVTFNENATIDGESKIIHGRGVNFLTKKIDDRSVAGNSRVTVNINGEGQVKSITYNIREYEDRQTVSLISIKNAIQKIKENDAFIEVESASDELIFENVHLSYWTQNTNEDNLTMQPVYVFSGTSITIDGNKEPFAITVQANKLS